MCRESKCCIIDDEERTNRRALMTGAKMITQRTDRLRLVAATEVLLAAEIEDRAGFAKLLGALVPETWPADNLRDVSGYSHFMKNSPNGKAGFRGMRF